MHYTVHFNRNTTKRQHNSGLCLNRNFEEIHFVTGSTSNKMRDYQKGKLYWILDKKTLQEKCVNNWLYLARYQSTECHTLVGIPEFFNKLHERLSCRSYIQVGVESWVGGNEQFLVTLFSQHSAHALWAGAVRCLCSTKKVLDTHSLFIFFKYFFGADQIIFGTPNDQKVPT